MKSGRHVRRAITRPVVIDPGSPALLALCLAEPWPARCLPTPDLRLLAIPTAANKQIARGVRQRRGVFASASGDHSACGTVLAKSCGV